MKSSKENHKKNGGSSSHKAESAEPAVLVVPVAEKGSAENGKEGHAKVPAATAEPQAGPAEPEPEKKRRGRAPSEGEPLRRVLIFLGPKEIYALRAQAGGRGVSTRIREILKEHLAKQG